ncbi:unnamed protein product [Haemonchus placei]|uniref:Uncharacterized protein n=1 Tax=Haemonchus placei TaxID=6290 RepID=A0A0N4WM35_HAEPC|nr:unnamed protein product [Haemonchus placei]
MLDVGFTTFAKQGATLTASNHTLEEIESVESPLPYAEEALTTSVPEKSQHILLKLYKLGSREPPNN